MRHPRAGEVGERAVAKETPERSAPCVYPESKPPRFEQVSGARAVGTGIAAARTQDYEAHVSILPYVAIRFDQVLEVSRFISRSPLAAAIAGSAPSRIVGSLRSPQSAKHAHIEGGRKGCLWLRFGIGPKPSINAPEVTLQCHRPLLAGAVDYPSGYAALVSGDLVVRPARPSDARAIAEVSVASRRWSYRGLMVDADMDALSVEETTADFAQGLVELASGSAVFVAEGAGHVVGYVYILTSPDPDVPEGTSELGSLYVTEDVAGTGVSRALMEAALEQVRAAGHGLLTAWVRRENGRARRFYEKYGPQPDGGERSGPHEVLPIEIDEIRYRMSLEPRRPQWGAPLNQ